MDIPHDSYALERQRLYCADLQENVVVEPGFCPVQWDELLCWNATQAGVLAKQPCPVYIYDMNKTGFATRKCDLTGEWVGGWTNYSDCFEEEDAVYDGTMKNDLAKINLMSKIGYTISLVSLVVAVLIMLISRRLHCKSNSLHINLFLAFILRALTFLLKDVLFVQGLGLEKDVIRFPSGSLEFNNDGGMHWECKFLVSLRMYGISASMMWILMEGLYLHMLVYKTLQVERSGIRVYVLIGWFSPLLFVIPWILVRINWLDTFCWNRDENKYMWIIVGPIVFSIVINFVFFIDIIRFLCARIKTQRTMTMTANGQQVRKLAKFALVMIPLFGVTYIITAAYPVGIDPKADIVYLYWDMFYNSFQGFILAVLFCFLNEEVHNEIRRFWHRRRRGSLTTKTFNLSIRAKGSSGSPQTSTSLATERKQGGLPENLDNNLGSPKASPQGCPKGRAYDLDSGLNGESQVNGGAKAVRFVRYKSDGNPERVELLVD